MKHTGNPGNQLKKLSTDRLSRSVLKVGTPWATSGIVIFALLCGFLFNAVQPSLMLNHSLAEDNSENLKVKNTEPEAIQETKTKLEKPVTDNSKDKEQKVNGTNSSKCTQNTGNNNQEGQQNESDKEKRPERLRKMISGIFRHGENDKKSQNESNGSQNQSSC